MRKINESLLYPILKFPLNWRENKTGHIETLHRTMLLSYFIAHFVEQTYIESDTRSNATKINIKFQFEYLSSSWEIKWIIGHP
jgi:hypothetical protein